MPEFGRFPSVTRAAKTHMTARQGETDSNLHPKREQRCALSVDLWGRRVRCYATSPRLASLAGSRSPAANRQPKRAQRCAPSAAAKPPQPSPRLASRPAPDRRRRALVERSPDRRFRPTLSSVVMLRQCLRFILVDEVVAWTLPFSVPHEVSWRTAQGHRFAGLHAQKTADSTMTWLAVPVPCTCETVPTFSSSGP